MEWAEIAGSWPAVLFTGKGGSFSAKWLFSRYFLDENIETGKALVGSGSTMGFTRALAAGEILRCVAASQFVFLTERVLIIKWNNDLYYRWKHCIGLSIGTLLTPSWCLGINLAVLVHVLPDGSRLWEQGQIAPEEAGPSRGRTGELFLADHRGLPFIKSLCPFIHAHLPHRRCECPSGSTWAK